MAEQDGNYQEMSVHDKEHPTLGPTEEEQDVATLDRIVVPPGAFLDPDNPNTINNSVNVSVNDHPNPLAADYGETATADVGSDDVKNTMSDELAKLVDEGADANPRTAAGRLATSEAPEDREEWQKKHWQAQAQAYGLSTSGNMGALRERVEEHEAEDERMAEFEKELHGMGREELDKVAADYDIDAESYSRKEDLAQAVLAAERGEDVPPGDKSEQ